MVDNKFIEDLQKSSKLPMVEYVENTIRLELEKATARGIDNFILAKGDYEVAKQEGIIQFKHYKYTSSEGYTKIFFKGVDNKIKQDKICRNITIVLIPLLLLTLIGSMLSLRF